MARPGRPRGANPPKTSRQRKADFDRRMRNTDGANPAAPIRTPIVVYLSDAARKVLDWNRTVLRLAHGAPVTDSVFIESLLLKSSPRSESRDPEPVIGDRKADLSDMRLAEAVAGLEARRRALVAQGKVLRSRLAKMGADQVDDVLLVHDREPSVRFIPLARELRSMLANERDDRRAAAALKLAIEGHLERLRNQHESELTNEAELSFDLPATKPSRRR